MLELEEDTAQEVATVLVEVSVPDRLTAAKVFHPDPLAAAREHLMM